MAHTGRFQKEGGGQSQFITAPGEAEAAEHMRHGPGTQELCVGWAVQRHTQNTATSGKPQILSYKGQALPSWLTKCFHNTPKTGSGRPRLNAPSNLNNLGTIRC